MEKEALNIGKTLTKVFIGGAAVAGIKKGISEMKKPASLDVPKIEPIAPVASSINKLCIEKYAADWDKTQKDLESPKDTYFYKDYNNAKPNKLPKAVVATLIAAGVLDAVASKNALAPFKHLGQGAKNFAYEWPKMILSKGRAGKILARGFKKATKKTDVSKLKKINTENIGFVRGMGIGAGIGTGNLAVHLIGDRHFDNKRAIQKSYDSIQEPVSEVYHQKERERQKADRYIDNRRTHSSGYNNHRIFKSASETLNSLFEKEAAVRQFANTKHMLKVVGKEDILQNGLKSIPYLLGPLGASYLINKDIRSDMKKVRGKNKAVDNRIVIDIPTHHLEGMNKSANATDAKNLYESMPWKHFFKHEMPRSLVRSLTWAAPMAALTAVTKRNLKGTGEKLDANSGKSRIIIETGSKPAQFEYDSKGA